MSRLVANILIAIGIIILIRAVIDFNNPGANTANQVDPTPEATVTPTPGETPTPRPTVTASPAATPTPRPAATQRAVPALW